MHSRSRRRPPSRLIVLLALPILASCQKPAAGPAKPTDKTSRAQVRLDQIAPAPQLPSDSAPAAAEPVPQAIRYLRTGQERFNERLWADATAALEKALQIDPNLAEARILLARTALQHGNPSLAESHLKEAMKLRPRDPTIHQLLGEISLQDRRYADAIAALRTALLAGQSTPGNPEVVLAHLSLALALKEEGYLAASVSELEAFAAATAQPSEEMSRYPELKEAMLLYRGKLAVMIADIHEKLGASDHAIAAYERAAAENPDDKSIRPRLARALARAGRTAEAIEQARKSLKEAPDDASSLNLLKEVCELAKDPSRFDAELVELAKQATSLEMRRKLATMLLDRKKTAEASEILSRLAADQPDDTESAYLLARLQFEQKKIREGLEQIAAVLTEHPSTYRDAFGILVQALLFKSIEDRLLAEAQSLTRDHPRDPAMHYLLALAYWANQQPSEVRKAADESLRLDKDFGPTNVLLAMTAAQDKQWEEAAKFAQSAIDGGISDAIVYLLKGTALEALDQYQEAEAALLESFRLDRKSVEPLFILAESAERRGEALRCEQIYRRILDDVDPKHAKSRERLVRLFLNTRKLDKAKEYFADFERLGQTGPEAERCQALMDLATSRGPAGTGRLEGYRKTLDAIIKRYPKDPATYVELAMTYEALGEFATALNEINAALKIDPGDQRALERKSRYQIKLLDFDGAAETTTVLLKRRPRDPELHLRRADLAHARADFDTAIQILKNLMARDDLKERRGQLLGRLWEVLKVSKRGEEAVQTAKDWLDLAPSDAQRRSFYLMALQLAERRDEAVESARQWLAADPTNDDLCTQYIEQLLGAKRYVEGQQRVLGWLASDADDLNLNRLLIRLSWAAKEWDTAIDLAQTGAEMTEHQPDYQARLGHTYRLARRFDEAIEFYRERAQSSENPADDEILLRVLIEAERFKEAEELASARLIPRRGRNGEEESVDLDTTLGLRNHLVRIYQLMGRESQAIQQSEEMLKIMPPDSADPRAPFYRSYVGIHNDLGYVLADSGLRIDEAEKMIRFALGEMPTEGAYVDSLGWVFYKRGRFDEAIVYLRRAILLMDREDSVLYDHLADALYRTDKIDEAREYWQKALAVPKPEDDVPLNAEERRVLERIKEKLEALEQEKEVPVAPLAEKEPTSRPTLQAARTSGEKPAPTSAPSLKPLPLSPRR